MNTRDIPNGGGVYLLHFDSRISGCHTTQHYLGWSDNFENRMIEHQLGRGARLTQVAIERHITWTIARLWPGKDRKFERFLKNKKNSPRLCPICNQEIHDA